MESDKRVRKVKPKWAQSLADRIPRSLFRCQDEAFQKFICDGVTPTNPWAANDIIALLLQHRAKASLMKDFIGHLSITLTELNLVGSETKKTLDPELLNDLLVELVNGRKSTVTSLTIINYQIDSKCIAVLSKSLNSSSELTHFRLDNCDFGGANAVGLFGKWPKTHRTLRSLKFIELHFDNATVKEIANLLAVSSYIKSLQIDGCGIDNNKLSLLSEGLLKNKGLTDLSLNRNVMGSLASQLFTALRNHETLKTLSVSQCFIDATCRDALNNLITSNRCINRLDVSGNDVFNGYPVIFQKNPMITHWNISQSSRLRMAISLENLKDNKSIIELRIRNVLLDAKSVEYLAKMIKSSPSLKVLDLSDCSITDAEPLLKSLDSKKCGLEELHMRLCNSKEIPSDLCKNRKLRVLDLSFNRLTSQAVDNLADFLRASPTIESLNVEQCELESNAALRLLDALIANPRLHTLRIANNQIGFEALEAFVKYTKKNSNLHQLSIHQPSTKKAGASVIKKMAKALESNTSLIDLDYSFFSPAASDSDSLRHVKNAMRRNLFAESPDIKLYLYKVLERFCAGNESLQNETGFAKQIWLGLADPAFGGSGVSALQALLRLSATSSLLRGAAPHQLPLAQYRAANSEESPLIGSLDRAIDSLKSLFY